MPDPTYRSSDFADLFDAFLASEDPADDPAPGTVVEFVMVDDSTEPAAPVS